jgi:hypothetical protein
MSVDHTPEERLRALNEQYIRSILTSDVEWFRTHLADEFICIESDATLMDKATFLARTAEPSTTASYHLDEVAVRCYGDVALVRATGSWTAMNGNRGISRYVDVYARQSGEWKVVSAQITRPGAAKS